MTWSVHPADDLLDRYRGAWQTLNTRCYNAHPLLDAKFVAPLYECFGSKDIRLVVREELSDHVVGLALLEKAGMGIWRLFMPSQANIGSILLDDGGSTERARDYLDDLMRSLPGCTLQIGLQKQDPLYSRAPDISHDLRFERIRNWTTSYVEITGSFDNFWRTKEKRVKQSVKQKFRDLTNKGMAWRLTELSDYADIAPGVVEHGRLESAGWKGREGTAIRGDNIQGKFYTDVLQNFARKINATIYQLYFDDALAASLLTISQNRMLIVLKTTYDESMAAFSPGRLIEYLMMERVFLRPEIHRIENYTNATAQDARWCSGTRTLYHVNLYRSHALRRMANIKRRITTFLTR